MQTEEENFLKLLFSKDKQNFQLAKQLVQSSENLERIWEKVTKAHAFFFGEGNLEEHHLPQV